jgi:hypothetical protein
VFQDVNVPTRRNTRRSALALLGAFALAPALLAGPAAADPAATAPASAGGAPERAASAPEPVKAVKTRMRRLSDEQRLSRWAHPARLSDIYSRHSASSRRVGKIRFFTEDGFPEVYLLLNEYVDAQEREWVQVRIPKRPNGGIGWVPRDALGPYNVNRFQLVVNRTTLRARLYKRGRVVWSAPVGVGASGTRTPAGRFWVREKFRFKNTPVYGTHAIGTSAYAPTLSDWPNGGVVGIHGTNQPGLIPGRPSHGCIRVKNQHIARLYRILPLGTPLLIR